MMTKADIAVVIPVYKEALSENEKLSLKACQRELAEYPTWLIAPKNLDISNYKKIHPSLRIQYFHPKYFKGVAGYNRLTMSSLLYKKFLSYKYVLIYQLDAFVFRDELLEWCRKDYDYIGAPWIAQIPLPKGKPLIDMSRLFHNQVGNGGFSLRKVRAHYKIAKLFRPVIWMFPKNEDFFWCYFVSKFHPNYKKPSVSEALKFAFELTPSKAYQRNNNQLPFGCHAWEKYEPEFWEKFIF